MITIEKQTIADIPSLHISKQADKHHPQPTVLFWHGLGSSKEQNLSFAYYLAEKGIRVVLPDALYHGEREGDMDAGRRTYAFWDIVMQAVEETEALLNEMTTYEWIDSGRVYVSGTSMGGIISCGALKSFEWIHGGMILMGSPSWKAMAEEQIRSLKKTPDWALSEREEQELLDKLAAYDLSLDPAKVEAKPIFFWHGKEDEVVPYELSYRFYERLPERESSWQAYYLQQEAGHKVTREGMIAASEWASSHI